MDKKLNQLFEYQRFAGNKKLEAMLFAAENRYPAQLSDEDLDFVNAAGMQTETTPCGGKKKLGTKQEKN